MTLLATGLRDPRLTVISWPTSTSSWPPCPWLARRRGNAKPQMVAAGLFRMRCRARRHARFQFLGCAAESVRLDDRQRNAFTPYHSIPLRRMSSRSWWKYSSKVLSVEYGSFKILITIHTRAMIEGRKRPIIHGIGSSNRIASA